MVIDIFIAVHRFPVSCPSATVAACILRRYIVKMELVVGTAFQYLR